MPRVLLDIYRPCPWRVRRAVSSVLPAVQAWAGDGPGPALVIIVCPGVVIRCPDGRFGWGTFTTPAKGQRPVIHLAAHKHDRRASDGQHVFRVLTTLAHELAHYEQWREGIKVQERGVAVRAKRILCSITD
jgi:hypothetical protein